MRSPSTSQEVVMTTHAHAAHQTAHAVGLSSLTRLAATATFHCLIGCSIGEVLGLVLATWLGWGNAASIALAVVLAFTVGYGFTLVPLRRGGMSWSAAGGPGL